MKLCLLFLVLVLFAAAQDKPPIPQYAVYISGEKNAGIWWGGSYERLDGKVVEIEWHRDTLPTRFSVNADCHLKLKIETEDAPIQAQTFYEYQEIKEWLATAKGIKGIPIAFDLPARN